MFTMHNTHVRTILSFEAEWSIKNASGLMRLLIIDKTGVLAANHERFAAFAALDDVILHVLTPERWFEHGRRVTQEIRKPDGYRVSTGYALRQGHYASGMYITGLGRAIWRARPDVILLLEEPWSFFAAQTMRWARLIAPRAKIVFYTWENIYRDFDYPSRLRRSYRRIDLRMHRRAAGAICATQQARDVLELKGFSKPAAVIPYGVSRAFFEAGQRRRFQHATRQTEAFTAAYIGRFLEMKGVHHLVEALVLATGVQLKLIGGGPMEPALRAQVERLRLGDRVTFLPPQPPEVVPALLETVDVLVLPSVTTPQWAEQLGRVVIEAMAAGVPVIASDSGALPEVIGDAGVVFREGKARELAERLIYVRDNDAIRQALMLRGRERALSRFTWSRFAADTADFLRREIVP